jgi:membrane fusion protein (multidrug efflux system)
LEREQILEKARRSVTLARTNLEYTEVRAPYDGVIARKWRHLGDYAGTGEPIFSMYNPALLYVTVHLEETLLEGVAPGNWARLDVDAFSEPFRGRVLWIGSATDGNFSLIPRDVSSGEFTYVVQRVPTRIAIEKDDRFSQLRPGLSVTVTIDHGPGDPDWARNALLEEARIAGIASPEEEQP